MRHFQLADVLPLKVVADGCSDLPAAERLHLDDVPLELSFPAVRHVIPLRVA